MTINTYFILNTNQKNELTWYKITARKLTTDPTTPVTVLVICQ